MKLNYCLLPPIFFLQSTPLKNVEEGTLTDCTGYLPPDNTAIHLAVVHTGGETAVVMRAEDQTQLPCTAAPGETAVVRAAADPELPEARGGGGEEAQFELFDSEAENTADIGSGRGDFFTVLSGSGSGIRCSLAFGSRIDLPDPGSGIFG
jgi:hypothetical protein